VENQIADDLRFKLLESMNYVIQSILAQQSTRSIAQSLLTQIQGLVAYARGSVMEFNFQSNKAALLAVQTDYKSKVQPEVQIQLDDFDGKFSRQPEVQMIRDLSQIENPTEIERQLYKEGIKTILTVPLYSRNDLVGLLNLGAREKETFTQQTISAIQELSALLTISIRQSRLSTQTEKDSQTKSVLVDEINHRVKNNLSAIIGLLHAKQKSFEKTSTINASEMTNNLITSIQGMATVHQILSATEWAPIAISDLAIQIIASVLNMTVESPVKYTVTPSGVTINPEKANSLALILNELILNFSKHVIEHIPDAEIMIDINEKNGEIIIEYSDTGTGFPNNVLERKQYSTGLFLVSEMVKKDLLGSVLFFNQHGAHVRISFKSKSGET
jgi:two-component sensor histidine kinase